MYTELMDSKDFLLSFQPNYLEEIDSSGTEDENMDDPKFGDSLPGLDESQTLMKGREDTGNESMGSMSMLINDSME